MATPLIRDNSTDSETTSNNAVNLLAYEMPDNSAATVTAEILAIDASGNTAHYLIVQAVKRINGLDAALVGTGDTVQAEDAITLAAVPAITVSGHDVRVTCTGKAATTITWVVARRVVNFVP